MTAIDLFAGIGGFHYGARANGIEVVFASEIDKYAASEYFTNHGLMPHGDITKIKAENIPKHDLLMAGFPCQAFSICGKRKGFEDTRGTLFFEIARIFKHHKPRFALLENVPGLLSHKSILSTEIIQKGLFGESVQTTGESVYTIHVILNTLQELGYNVKIKKLNSKNFGVPQNRERIFIACFREEKDYWSFQFPQGCDCEICLADILESNVEEKYFLSKQIAPYVKSREGKFLKIDPKISPAILSKYGSIGSGSFIRELNKCGELEGKNYQGYRIYREDGISQCLAANGGGVGTKTGLYLVGGANGTKASQRVYSDKGAMSTLTQVQQKIESKERIRRLTPRECARLQGFPESHVIGVSDAQAYKQFGNAVTVNVVKEILKNIKKTEER